MGDGDLHLCIRSILIEAQDAQLHQDRDDLTVHSHVCAFCNRDVLVVLIWCQAMAITSLTGPAGVAQIQ